MSARASTSETTPLLSITDSHIADGNVFGLIHDVSRAVKSSIDTALTWDQLTAPEVNYTVVRPLVLRWGKGKGKNEAIIYALMVNRIQFTKLAEADLAFSALQTTRASLCELLAIKLLRCFAESELELVRVLTQSYNPFQGAPEEVWKGLQDDKEDLEEEIGNALEMSIVASAKHFLSTPLSQRVVKLIHSGEIIYTTRSQRSLISDNYTSPRRTAQISTSESSLARAAGLMTEEPAGAGEGSKGAGGVYLYDPRMNGWLDYTRLRVPKWRTILEFFSFSLLVALFVWNLASKNNSAFNFPEIVFIIYTLGFALDELASISEHGFIIYFSSVWNAIDLSFIFVFVVYLAMRVIGLVWDKKEVAELGYDVLSMGACILFPRIAFFFIRDNIIIISLKAMIADFVRFMLLAMVCFSGILYTLYLWGSDTWTVRQIAWLMLQIWFGSSYLGFSASTSFHPIFGPALLVLYAALSNTLLVTILISILSNRFAEINSNAKEEHLYQKTINTVEGVKADAIFSYLPPVNILAYLFLAPLSLVLDSHKLHRVNIFCIRLTSFPILIAISCYERWKWQKNTLSGKSHAKAFEAVPNTVPSTRVGLLESILGVNSDSAISAVFDHSGEDSSVLLRADELGPTVDDELPKAKDDTKLAPEEPTTPTTPETSKTALPEPRKPQMPASPLGRLWGRTTNDKAESKRVPVTEGEVADLRKQLHEMKDSQARMEALLVAVRDGLTK